MPELIQDGLYRIEVPLPNNPLRMLNAYCIRGGDRHLLIDTGFNRPECLAAMTAALDELGVDRRKLDICVTHLHADHCGLAPDLVDGPDAAIMCSAGDGTAINGMHDRAAFRARLVESMRPHGFSAEELEEIGTRHPAANFGPGRAVDFTVLRDGDLLRYGGYALRVISVPGHTPDQITLYEPERKLYFSADHILGDITPNITRWPGVADSLGNYLRSLEAVLALDIVLTLPGHRSVIRDTPGRIRRLQAHHAARLDEVRRILGRGETDAYTAASQMTWDMRGAWPEFPTAQKNFAVGEALSHLDRLAALGEAEQTTRGDRAFFRLR